MSRSKVLFKLSGSIACYKACNVISKLVQEGFEVQTACTESALQFIGPATLVGLTGKPVFTDGCESGRMLDHIWLAKWADIAVLCPATANSINKIANGIADNAIGNLFLAYDLKKPYIVAPAMNSAMLAHPATAASLEKLKQWGITVLPTGTGRQACGDIGPGRMLEPDAIFLEIINAINNRENRA
ncbi:MAG: flavoprotein [Bdellovibrionota bacterium]